MPPSPTPAPPSEDCRCVCGSLIARLVEGAVELKCRRCKRTLIVALEGATPSGTDPRASVPLVRVSG